MQNAQDIAQKTVEVNVWLELAKIAIPSLVTLAIGWWLSFKTENYKKDLLKEIEDYKKELSKELEAHKHSLQETAETKKLRREKLEELHNLMTIYSLNIIAYAPRLINLAKNDADGYMPISESIINPLAKINTILMLYSPNLEFAFRHLIDAANFLNSNGSQFMAGKENFDEVVKWRNALQECCRNLINHIEHMSYIEIGLIKPPNQNIEKVKS